MDIGDQRAIGRLEGKLDHIIADQDRARTERKNQYERQEVTDRHIEQIGQKLDALDARLKKVEESASEISKWRERGVGRRCLYRSWPLQWEGLSPLLAGNYGQLLRGKR